MLSQDNDMQTKSQSCRTKMKPQTVAKKLYHKTFRNIKSFLSKGYLKLPRNPFSNPVFSYGHKIGPKLQETDDEEVKKEERKGDEQCSKSSTSVSDQSRSEDLKEEKKNARKSSGETSFLATEKFAQKMEELEMMDVNNGNHVMDIEEVIHQYSLLTSPVYQDIIDNFFKDVYLELYLPQPSVSLNGSMRKVVSGSVRGSMRKLGSGTDSLRGSMSKVGSDSVRGSMRVVGSDSVRGSMRKVGSDSVHGSMRKVGSTSVHGSMRKLASDNVHGSMRKLGPLKL